MFEQCLVDFLRNYLNVNCEFFDENDMLRDSVVKLCINYLLDHEVFTKSSMKKVALKDYHIIIPEKYFEK